MPQRRSPLWPIVVALIGVLAVIIALPQSWKGPLPGFLKNPGLHLGLDLAGGTQLDFRISEQEINDQLAQVQKELADAQKKNAPPETINELQSEIQSIQTQQANLVEAIRSVLEKRINGLGVSEATITPSYVGSEKHLLVQCPGVVDVQKCIDVVGKTIQLQFKEEFTEPTAAFTKDVTVQADATFKDVSQGKATLEKEGQDLGTQVGMYQPAQAYFQDQLPKGMEKMWTAPVNQVMETQASADCQKPDTLPVDFLKQYCVTDQGQLAQKQIPGIFLTEVIRPLTETGRLVTDAPTAFALVAKTASGASYGHQKGSQLTATFDQNIAAALRGMQPGGLKTVTVSPTEAHILFLNNFTKGKQEITASHILVQYKGASAAAPTVTRTKQEALTKAQQLKAQLDKGANFEQLARTQSDGPSAKDGGSLGTFSQGTMVPAFESALFALKPGQVSQPVETQFGYHLIRLDKPIVSNPDAADYDELVVKGPGAQQRADALVKQLQGGVRTQEKAVTLRSVFFSLQPSGWKDTDLDGKHFRSAAVSIDPTTNLPVVQILFDSEGAKLFDELTKRNIGKRIAIFVGGQLVTQPTVNQEISGGSAVITGSSTITAAQNLAQDLNTGAIPAPIHLVGQETIEATLGASALQTSLLAALLGTIILMVYMIVIYRALGVVADLALLVYAILLFAILKLPLLLFSQTYIVLTLAGMAGIILSIGMAVDANVLVFERMKEELRKGKIPKTAVESSFKYAWPAIRDSNISTLITCGILFLVGTSLVRGFAVTLGMGVLLSLFTAVTVTRWILRKVAASPLGERPELFGVKPEKPTDQQ